MQQVRGGTCVSMRGTAIVGASGPSSLWFQEHRNSAASQRFSGESRGIAGSAPSGLVVEDERRSNTGQMLCGQAFNWSLEKSMLSECLIHTFALRVQWGGERKRSLSSPVCLWVWEQF